MVLDPGSSTCVYTLATSCLLAKDICPNCDWGRLRLFFVCGGVSRFFGWGTAVVVATY